MTGDGAAESEGAAPPGHGPIIIITLDGPAGSGKSSVARTLALRLGVDFLDTGAMYRAAAAIIIDRKIDPRDTPRVVEVVADADLHFDWAADPPIILAWLKPIDDRIRDADVNALVAQVATIAAVREHLVAKQRLIARQHPRLVSEGRDQGSIVFPGANAKFYLDANPEVRARRRAMQIQSSGRDADERSILADILRRDTVDSTRDDGPLICPDDARRIDTSEMSFDEVVALLERLCREQVAALSTNDGD